MPEICPMCNQDGCEDHCFWCGATVTGAEVRHTKNCPSMTGVYFALPDDVEMGLVCVECDAEFAEGEPYVEQSFGTAEIEGREVDVYEIVCLGCGAERSFKL